MVCPATKQPTISQQVHTYRYLSMSPRLEQRRHSWHHSTPHTKAAPRPSIAGVEKLPAVTSRNMLHYQRTGLLRLRDGGCMWTQSRTNKPVNFRSAYALPIHHRTYLYTRMCLGCGAISTLFHVTLEFQLLAILPFPLSKPYEAVLRDVNPRWPAKPDTRGT